jgi:hypothetical protein
VVGTTSLVGVIPVTLFGQFDGDRTTPKAIEGGHLATDFFFFFLFIQNLINFVKILYNINMISTSCFERRPWKLSLTFKITIILKSYKIKDRVFFQTGLEEIPPT